LNEKHTKSGCIASIIWFLVIFFGAYIISQIVRDSEWLIPNEGDRAVISGKISSYSIYVGIAFAIVYNFIYSQKNKQDFKNDVKKALKESDKKSSKNR